MDALEKETSGGEPCAFEVVDRSLGIREHVKANAGIYMPPRQSNTSELVGFTRSTKSVNQLHDMGDALFSVEMSEAQASGFARGIHNGTRCGGGKTAFLQEQLIRLSRDGLALFLGEGCEWKDIGDGWVVDREVTEEAFTMIAGTAADTICHFMAFVAKFLKLLLVVLVHAEMESKCFVSI